MTNKEETDATKSKIVRASVLESHGWSSEQNRSQCKFRIQEINSLVFFVTLIFSFRSSLLLFILRDNSNVAWKGEGTNEDIDAAVLHDTDFQLTSICLWQKVSSLRYQSDSILPPPVQLRSLDIEIRKTALVLNDADYDVP